MEAVASLRGTKLVLVTKRSDKGESVHDVSMLSFNLDNVLASLKNDIIHAASMSYIRSSLASRFSIIEDLKSIDEVIMPHSNTCDALRLGLTSLQKLPILIHNSVAVCLSSSIVVSWMSLRSSHLI